MHKNTLLAFIISTPGHHLVSLVSSWALVSLSSLTVTVIAAFSPVGICSDDPARAHPFLMSGSQRPSSPVGCQLSVPLVKKKEEEHPPTPQPHPETQLRRTGSHGEPLMIHMMAWASHCLGYITQRGTNNRSQCHLIMAQKANLTDLHSSQG